MTMLIIHTCSCSCGFFSYTLKDRLIGLIPVLRLLKYHAKRMHHDFVLTLEHAMTMLIIHRCFISWGFFSFTIKGRLIGLIPVFRLLKYLSISMNHDHVLTQENTMTMLLVIHAFVYWVSLV